MTDDMQAGTPETSTASLERYLADIRDIKHTIAQVERSFRIGWGFYVWTSVLIALAGAANIALRLTIEPTLTQTLLWVWLPFFLMIGLVELWAWLRKSREDHMPLFTPTFIRFAVGAAGTMVAITCLLLELLFSGIPAPGPVLLATGPVLLFYSRYSNDAAVISGVALVACGVVFWLAGAAGFWWMIAVGALCWAVFLGVGIYERSLSSATPDR